MREKKVDNFQLSWRILEIVKRKETFIKMAANNVKTGFHLHSMGFTKILSGIWQGSTTIKSSSKKISTNNQNKISTEFTSEGVF